MPVSYTHLDVYKRQVLTKVETGLIQQIDGKTDYVNTAVSNERLTKEH